MGRRSTWAQSAETLNTSGIRWPEPGASHWRHFRTIAPITALCLEAVLETEPPLIHHFIRSARESEH
jgi:hypothetical protein